MQTTDVPTTALDYVGAIAQALEARGIDADDILHRAGVAFTPGNSPLDRIPITTVSRLFELAVEATDDPYFGLGVAKFIHAGTFHALGYSMLASSTLRDFCERVARYFRIASQAAVVEVRSDAAEFVLVLGQLQEGVCWETQDAAVAFLVRFMRLISAPGFNPLRIELIRPMPPDGGEPFLQCFKVPVAFGQGEARIHLDPEVVDRELVGGNREIAQINDQVAMSYVARLDRGDVVAQVRAAIVELLSAGGISKVLVAEKLHMSPRTLQQKLAARHTSFQKLLDSTRSDLARSYIDQRALSVTEITYLLGFSDTSNFTRAFKRWTGVSPSEFRAG